MQLLLIYVAVSIVVTGLIAWRLRTAQLRSLHEEERHVDSRRALAVRERRLDAAQGEQRKLQVLREELDEMGAPSSIGTGKALDAPSPFKGN